MSKKYRLLKEWPDAQIGDIYKWNGQGYSNQSRTAMVISKAYVEVFSDWFEEVIDRIEVVDIRVSANNHLIIAVKGCDGAEVRIAAIKQAIEAVLNDEAAYKIENFGFCTVQSGGRKFYVSGVEYVPISQLEDAFNAGQEFDYFTGYPRSFKYRTFQHYLKSKNEYKNNKL